MSSEVAVSLKERFNQFIDQRTELGKAKYGRPLLTHNGRDSGLDMLQEILDFCQYQEQARLELVDRIKELEGQIRSLLGDIDTGWQ